MKVKPGVILMIFSFLGFVFGLSSQTLTMMEKIPISLICFILMVVGILIENPIFTEIKDGNEHLEEGFR